MVCGKFRGLRGCDTDQKTQDTVRDLSSESRVLANASGQSNVL